MRSDQRVEHRSTFEPNTPFVMAKKAAKKAAPKKAAKKAAPKKAAKKAAPKKAAKKAAKKK